MDGCYGGREVQEANLRKNVGGRKKAISDLGRSRGII
jgi:hypothetical protein